MKTILIDNGHGSNTPGKRSPDGRILEWQYTRRLAVAIAEALRSDGIEAIRIVPEDTDVALRERVRRANSLAHRYGVENTALLSLHLNAAGDGRTWLQPRGWSAWIATHTSETTERLARCLYDEACRRLPPGNRWTPACGFHRASFMICRATVCPTVLTENLFMDNPRDVGWLLSREGFEALVALHVEAVRTFAAS